MGYCCSLNKVQLAAVYHQAAPRDCQALAGSLLGFLATRAASPLVTIDVFSNIFSRLTNHNGEKSLHMSFNVAYVTHAEYSRLLLYLLQYNTIFIY